MNQSKVNQQAAAQGFDAALLDGLRNRVLSDVEAQRYDGARVIVARRGEVVLDLTEGFHHRETGRNLAADAVFSVMSLTKVMTATALLGRIERGDLTLMTTVAEVIPEFAVNGKSRITIAQMLTHTAGLGLAPVPLPIDKQGNLSEAVQAICKMAPETTPGELVTYSATTAFTILAEVLRRIDGGKRTYRQILAEDLFTPLGMHDSAVGMPDRLQSRRVPLVVRDLNAPELSPANIAAREKATHEQTELPSGGVYGTAHDVLRFAEALRLGGALNGQRILSPAMVRLMTTNQTGLKPNSLMTSSRALHGFAEYPAYLGLGLFLRGEGISPSLFANLASPASFGGFGLGSAAFWVDPEREMSFVALTSGLMERIRSLLRFQVLGDMALAALVDEQ